MLFSEQEQWGSGAADQPLPWSGKSGSGSPLLQEQTWGLCSPLQIAGLLSRCSTICALGLLGRRPGCLGEAPEVTVFLALTAPRLSTPLLNPLYPRSTCSSHPPSARQSSLGSLPRRERPARTREPRGLGVEGRGCGRGQRLWVTAPKCVVEEP